MTKIELHYWLLVQWCGKRKWIGNKIDCTLYLKEDNIDLMNYCWNGKLHNYFLHWQMPGYLFLFGNDSFRCYSCCISLVPRRNSKLAWITNKAKNIRSMYIIHMQQWAASEQQAKKRDTKQKTTNGRCFFTHNLSVAF